MSENSVMSAETIEIIMKILKRGDSVELKRENGKLVVVEIKRQVKSKTSIIG